jgi:hypothetical protein
MISIREDIDKATLSVSVSGEKGMHSLPLPNRLPRLHQSSLAYNIGRG